MPQEPDQSRRSNLLLRAGANIQLSNTWPRLKRNDSSPSHKGWTKQILFTGKRHDRKRRINECLARLHGGINPAEESETSELWAPLLGVPSESPLGRQRDQVAGRVAKSQGPTQSGQGADLPVSLPSKTGTLIHEEAHHVINWQSSRPGDKAMDSRLMGY